MSSQYGYIPLNKVPEIQQQYSIADPSTWTFEKAGELYGGLEENAFSDLQKAEIIALGGQWFESADAFLVWLNS